MAKLFIESTTLTNIADAIRGKDGTSDPITPLQMPERITNLPTGGGEDLVPATIKLTGSCSHLFDTRGGYPGTGLYWIAKNYGDRIVCENINDANYMFAGMTADQAPESWDFILHLRGAGTSTYSSGCKVEHIFEAYKGTSIPNVSDGAITSFTNFMQNASEVTEIPRTWLTSLDWSVAEDQGLGNSNFAFSRCLKLREYPREFFNHFTSTYVGNMQTFYQCFGINEFLDWPVPKKDGATLAQTGNMFNQTFQECSHAKEFTFEMNNGVPYVATWSNQTLDLSNYFGYFKDTTNAAKAGFTNDKRIGITDNYDELKDDPDAWATDVGYSRYTRSSAVRTINSLPDCSAGTSNVVKFKSTSGNKIAGEEIGTLTEAEIAVAAAKGWTVTLV